MNAQRDFLNWGVNAGWFYGALIILSAWILHSFFEALLAACVAAIATWPLYKRFASRFSRRITRSAASLIFTAVVAVFVLVPALLAFGALLTEAYTLLEDVAAADEKGISVPRWLDGMPWLAALWEKQLAHPGPLRIWAERIDAAALLGLAQSLGHFITRHAFIIAFTVLVLFFLYEEGESLAQGIRRALRQLIGERADAYADLATQAVRASVNSMLIVGLFDGFATWVVYAMAGAPHAALWAAITGALALVPFLGYVAVAALSLQLALKGAVASALLSLTLASAVLFCGDKIVRPAVAGGGTRLPFVWVLMGCLGGFEVLGLVGLVIGPVALTLARELWQQRVRDLARPAPNPVCERE